MGGSGLGGFLQIIGMGIALLALGPAGWGFWGVVAGMGVSMVGGMLSQQEMKRDAEDALRRAREAMAGLRINARTQLKAIQVLYGRARVGGNIVYMKTDGPSNRDLHTLWGVGEGPIDGFEEVWFNDVKVWDVAKIATSSGQLETPYKGWFDFDYRLGTNAQSRFSQVNAIDPDFVETYPMIAMAYVKFAYSADKYQSVPTVNFVVRGRILNRPWDAGSGWTDSPPLVAYDQMTHPRYGLGVSTTAVNCGSWLAANSYAQEPPPVWNQWIEESVEQVSFGPRKFTETVPLHMIVDSADNYLGNAGNIGGGEGVKLPIRPGSVTLRSYVLPDPESGGGGYDVWYKDVPSGGLGIMATTGTIVNSNGSTVGSVDYYSGVIGVGNPPSSPEATWFGGYGVVFRTKYQYLARSLSLACGSETLVETGTITTTGYLISSQGGWGIIDYTNGILEARLGGVDWFNFSSATVRYKVGTLSLRRFSYNGGYVDASPVLDQVRDVLAHMRGFLVFAGGEYKLKTERPGSSVYSFNDDNIVAGSFKVNLPSLKDKPNRIRVKYVDALQAYTPKDAVYEVGSPADVQGSDREQTIVLPGCVYRDQAHRIAQTVANAAGLGIAVSFETKAVAMDLEPGDIVDVTHPACLWSGKLFRVWYVAPGNDEKVEIRAFEHDDSIYADAWPYGDMKSIAPSAYPTKSYFAPEVTSLSLMEVYKTLSDGTIASGIRMKVEATSGSALPAGYRFYSTYETTSKAPILLYEGKDPEYIYGPVPAGNYNVAAYSYSDWGVQGAIGKSYTIQVLGRPEFAWQNLRIKEVAHYDHSVFPGYYPTVFELNGKRYVTGTTSGSLWLKRISGGTEIITTRVASVDSTRYYSAMVQNSGSCVSVFWYFDTLASAPVYGATFDPTSLTCIRSPYMISSVMEARSMYPMYGGSFAANSAGQLYWFGFSFHGSGNGETALNRHVRYCALSCSMDPSTSTYMFDSNSFTTAGNANILGLSAFFAQSLGAVIYGGSNTNSPANLREEIRAWTFDHNVGSRYSNEVLVASLSPVMNGLTVQANAFFPEVTVLTVDRIVGSAWNPQWGVYFTVIDVRTPTATPLRWYYSYEDLKGQTDTYWYGSFQGKPIVTKDSFAVGVLAQDTYASSPYLDLDVYKYWNITSPSPFNMMTWNWT